MSVPIAAGAGPNRRGSPSLLSLLARVPDPSTRRGGLVGEKDRDSGADARRLYPLLSLLFMALRRGRLVLGGTGRFEVAPLSLRSS